MAHESFPAILVPNKRVLTAGLLQPIILTGTILLVLDQLQVHVPSLVFVFVKRKSEPCWTADDSLPYTIHC